MSNSLKLASVLVLLAACGPGGSKPPQIHLDMGTGQHPDGMMMMNCNQPLSLCNGACVNFTNDVNNCGSCGNACPNSESCSNSTCGTGACAGNQVKCNGVCTDTSTDINNCGSCGNACLNNQTCVGGKCMGAMMGGMTGCNGFLMCQQPCMDAQCFQNCFDNTNMQGQQLVMDLINCLDMACPSAQGGVCDPNGNMAACNTCYMNAQSNNGACVGALSACVANKP
jgi:hypothetical protein